MFLFQRRVDHRFLPENFACLSVQAEQHAVLTLAQRRDGENAVVPNNGRGVAVAGHVGFPDDIAGRAPVDGHMGFRPGSVTARTSPGGPVFSAQADPASKQTKKDPGAAEPQAKPVAGLMTRSSPPLTPGRWVDRGPFRLPRPFVSAAPRSKMSAAKQRLEPGCQEAAGARHNLFHLLERTFPDSPLAHKSFSRCNRKAGVLDTVLMDRGLSGPQRPRSAFRGLKEYVLLPPLELPKL